MKTAIFNKEIKNRNKDMEAVFLNIIAQIGDFPDDYEKYFEHGNYGKQIVEKYHNTPHELTVEILCFSLDGYYKNFPESLENHFCLIYLCFIRRITDLHVLVRVLEYILETQEDLRFMKINNPFLRNFDLEFNPYRRALEIH